MSPLILFAVKYIASLAACGSSPMLIRHMSCKSHLGLVALFTLSAQAWTLKCKKKLNSSSSWHIVKVKQIFQCLIYLGHLYKLLKYKNIKVFQGKGRNKLKVIMINIQQQYTFHLIGIDQFNILSQPAIVLLQPISTDECERGSPACYGQIEPQATGAPELILESA